MGLHSCPMLAFTLNVWFLFILSLVSLLFSLASLSLYSPVLSYFSFIIGGLQFVWGAEVVV